MSTIGERVKKSRQEEGLTQTQLGEILGMTKSNVSDYERNKANPPIKVLMKISDLCKIDFEWLATGRGDKAPRTESDDRAVFKLNKKLFKGCLTAVLKLVQKYELNYSSGEIADVTIALYKYFIIQKVETIDNIDDEQMIDIIKVLAA